MTNENVWILNVIFDFERITRIYGGGRWASSDTEGDLAQGLEEFAYGLDEPQGWGEEERDHDDRPRIISHDYPRILQYDGTLDGRTWILDGRGEILNVEVVAASAKEAMDLVEGRLKSVMRNFCGTCSITLVR